MKWFSYFHNGPKSPAISVCKSPTPHPPPTHTPFLSGGLGIPKDIFLDGGEVEEWKGYTFLLDGIRLPIGRAGGNGKIIPHFPKWNKWGYIGCEVERRNCQARALVVSSGIACGDGTTTKYWFYYGLLFQKTGEIHSRWIKAIMQSGEQLNHMQHICTSSNVLIKTHYSSNSTSAKYYKKCSLSMFQIKHIRDMY